MTLIQVYAPTTEPEEEEGDKFYDEARPQFHALSLRLQHQSQKQ